MGTLLDTYFSSSSWFWSHRSLSKRRCHGVWKPDCQGNGCFESYKNIWRLSLLRIGIWILVIEDGDIILTYFSLLAADFLPSRRWCWLLLEPPRLFLFGYLHGSQEDGKTLGQYWFPWRAFPLLLALLSFGRDRGRIVAYLSLVSTCLVFVKIFIPLNTLLTEIIDIWSTICSSSVSQHGQYFWTYEESIQCRCYICGVQHWQHRISLSCRHDNQGRACKDILDWYFPALMSHWNSTLWHG